MSATVAPASHPMKSIPPSSPCHPQSVRAAASIKGMLDAQGVVGREGSGLAAPQLSSLMLVSLFPMGHLCPTGTSQLILPHHNSSR